MLTLPDASDAVRTLGEFVASDVFRGLVLAAAAFRAGAAYAVVDQPKLPPLTGEFEHVGVRYTRCGDGKPRIFLHHSSVPYAT